MGIRSRLAAVRCSPAIAWGRVVLSGSQMGVVLLRLVRPDHSGSSSRCGSGQPEARQEPHPRKLAVPPRWAEYAVS